MNTIELRYKDIPLYLQKGEFYRNLEGGDPQGRIEIPVHCFHVDGESAENLDEFSQLLRVMVFWMLEEIPLGVLQFCSQNKMCVWHDTILNFPEAQGLNILPSLQAAYPDEDTLSLAEIFLTGRWEVIVHTVDRISRNSSATAFAAGAGNLRALQLLHEEGFDWHSNTCVNASQFGHLECLKYAHENGCPWDGRVHQRAAQHGHLRCLQYAHEQALQWPPDVCELAALHGHLACLSYAHEKGGSWDRDTVASAAQNGHVDCVKYALEHGCPHDEKASNMACLNGHVACLQLLHRHHSPWDATTSVNAAVCADADCLRYLHQHGCPYTEHLMVYAAFNCLECLQYLVGMQGLYMNERVFMAALLHGDLAILKYLVDQYCPYLAATFSNEEDEILLYDKVFRKNNPEFALCVKHAMERGWVPNEHFKSYISSKEDERVDGDFFEKEMWLVKSCELNTKVCG